MALVMVLGSSRCGQEGTSRGWKETIKQAMVPEPGKRAGSRPAGQAAGQGPGKSHFFQDPLGAESDIAEQFPIFQTCGASAPDQTEREQDITSQTLGKQHSPCWEKTFQEGRNKNAGFTLLPWFSRPWGDLGMSPSWEDALLVADLSGKGADDIWGASTTADDMDVSRA